MNETIDHRYVGHDPQARVDVESAHRAFTHVEGMSVADALLAMSFFPSARCPQAARVIQMAAAKAHRDAGLSPDELIVGPAIIGEGEDVVRVRRQAHGMADWIYTKTTEIFVEIFLAHEHQEHA